MPLTGDESWLLLPRPAAIRTRRRARRVSAGTDAAVHAAHTGSACCGSVASAPGGAGRTVLISAASESQSGADRDEEKKYIFHFSLFAAAAESDVYFFCLPAASRWSGAL